MSTNDSALAEIPSLLRRVPQTWETFDSDSLSAAESQAFFLLVAAGTVERRFELRLRMLNHPLAVSAQAAATGEGGLAEALNQVVAGMWHDWRAGFEQWQQGETRNTVPFLCERIGQEQWRLTCDGVLARSDLDTGRAETVLDFVLKRHKFAHRPAFAGSGRLLKFDRAPIESVPADGAPVQITNCEELARGLAAAFEQAVQQRNGSAEDELSKSGLPSGPGSGELLNGMIAAYIAKRQQHYDQLVEGAVANDEGARERLEAMFGPRAMARCWMSEWVSKLRHEINDEEHRKALIEKEESRIAGSIKRQPQYDNRIKPPLNGRQPDNWQPRARSSEAMNPIVAELLQQGRES